MIRAYLVRSTRDGEEWWGVFSEPSPTAKRGTVHAVMSVAEMDTYEQARDVLLAAASDCGICVSERQGVSRAKGTEP